MGIKISMMNAARHINKIETRMANTYQIEIIDNACFPKGFGGVSNSATGNMNVYMNKSLNTHGVLNRYVDNMDFVNYLRVLFHEEQHIKQTCSQLYNPKDADAIQMAIKNIACQDNDDYYNGQNHRYNTNLAEIDAERAGIIETYKYLKDNVSEEHAESLVCEMVNHRIINADYFITRPCDSMAEIIEAFNKQYEQAKFAQIEHMIPRLRQSQQVKQNDDEYVKYLQQIVKDNPENVWLMDMIWQEHDAHEHDKMVAAIVLHLHPEMDYKRIYPCLINEDLSPQTIFGRNIPSIPQTMTYDDEIKQWTQVPLTEPMDVTKIEYRIHKVNLLHTSIKNNDKNENRKTGTIKASLDETYLPSQKQTHNDISPPFE